MLRTMPRGLLLLPLLMALSACQADMPPPAASGTPAAQAEMHAAGQIQSGPAPEPAPAGMAWVPGGTFWMGCEHCEMPDALPVHLVGVDGFWMDRTPVTNAEFAAFVRPPAT